MTDDVPHSPGLSATSWLQYRVINMSAMVIQHGQIILESHSEGNRGNHDLSGVSCNEVQAQLSNAKISTMYVAYSTGGEAVNI